MGWRAGRVLTAVVLSAALSLAAAEVSFAMGPGNGKGALVFVPLANNPYQACKHATPYARTGASGYYLIEKVPTGVRLVVAKARRYFPDAQVAEIDSVYPGPYILMAAKEGYETLTQEFDPDAVGQPEGEGPRAIEITLWLEPLGVGETGPSLWRLY